MKQARIGTLVALSLALLTGAAGAAETMSVFKTSGCGCCLGWIKAMENAGNRVEARNVAMGDLMQMKLKAGFKVEHASCHTTRIGPYVLEGHVPAREIERLLAERPDAVGLAVPGMPLGSPGMDFGKDRDAFDVLLLRRDGTTEAFARYPAS
jgi:hypothetical protein